MTVVSEGMDVAKVRNVAAAMISLGARVDDVRGRGKAQTAVLQHAWEGPDLEKFTDRWNSSLPAITNAGQALRDFGRDLHHQADQQTEASDGVGGRGRREIPTIPRCPLPPPPPKKPGFFERIWDGIKGAIKGVLDFTKKVLDGITDLFNNMVVKIGLLINDLVEGLKKVSAEFRKWIDDAVRGIGNFVKKWAPKLLDWGKKAMPFLKVLGKFAKAIPVLSVIAAVWDAKDVFVDLWNGKINPHEFWNKIVLGGAATVASFFPGPGTLISVALTLEQMRHEHIGKLDSWIADKTGIDEGIIKGLRVGLSSGTSPLAIFDLLPNQDFDLPGPSPAEVFDDAVRGAGDLWDKVKKMDPPIIGLPPIPLPWP